MIIMIIIIDHLSRITLQYKVLLLNGALLLIMILYERAFLQAIVVNLSFRAFINLW